MNFPFLWSAMGFSLGIVAEKYTAIPPAWVGCGLGAGILLLWFLHGRRFFLPLFVLLVGCAGILWAQLENNIPAYAIQNFVGPERVSLRGIMQSLPEMKARGKKTNISLVLRASSITVQRGGHWKRKTKSGDVQVFLLQSSFLPQVGDELRLFGTLSLPRQVLNPGEFDYGKFLALQKIHAIFQVIGKKSVRLIKPGSDLSPARWIANVRRSIGALIDRSYRPGEAAILKALVIGLRSDVSSEVRDCFFKSGTIHLLAISGMNITMVAGTFYLIFLFSGLEFRVTVLLTVLIVIVYVGFAGAGIPVQRAGYGSALVLIAVLAGRPSSLLNSLCFAIFAILVWNPRSLWNVGFQLSFLCVFSLILIHPLVRRLSLWTFSVGSSLAVLCGTFPVLLYYFNIFSPVSLLANLVAIPLCDPANFIVLLAILFHPVPFLNAALVRLSSGMVRALLAWVRCLSTWQWGYWFLEKPSLARILAYYAVLALILFCHKKIFRWKRFVMTGLICLWLGFSVSFLIGKSSGNFEFTLLASGRNQLTHARFMNGSQWIVNAGKSFPSDQGEWLIAPYLRSRGVQHLEGILLTDLSGKHTRGLASVLRDFPARQVLYPSSSLDIPVEFWEILRRLGHKVKSFRQGDVLSMASEKIRVVAQSQKGAALLVASGPWRILLVPRWDDAIFSGLLRQGEGAEIHAVCLPPLEPRIPDDFYAWIDRARPLLVVMPDLLPDVAVRLASRGISCLDPKSTGAIRFTRNVSRLEIASFLNGFLGFYAYL
jgi:competence protein ComEC